MREESPPFYLESHMCLVKAQVLGPSQICSIKISKERSQKSVYFNLCVRERLGHAVVEDGDGDRIRERAGVAVAPLGSEKATRIPVFLRHMLKSWPKLYF